MDFEIFSGLLVTGQGHELLHLFISVQRWNLFFHYVGLEFRSEGWASPISTRLREESFSSYSLRTLHINKNNQSTPIHLIGSISEVFIHRRNWRTFIRAKFLKHSKWIKILKKFLIGKQRSSDDTCRWTQFNARFYLIFVANRQIPKN